MSVNLLYLGFVGLALLVLATSSAFGQAAEVRVLKSDTDRLKEISMRLSSINVELSSQLSACRTNLTIAQLQLANSGLELQDLTLRIAELERLNLMQSMDLQEVKSLLSATKASLTNSQASLDAYRKEAEREVRKWKLISVAGPVGVALIAILVEVIRNATPTR